MTPKFVLQIEQDLLDEQFQRAADVIDLRLSNKTKSRRIYRLGIYAHIRLKNYTHALELFELLTTRCMPDKNDLYQLGYIHTMLNNLDRAQEYYQEVLIKAPDDSYALNGMGYILGLQGQHAAAIGYLDKAIRVSHAFSYAYCNRGYSKIHSGQLEAGLQDINHSLELDDKNAYAHRNLGIYYQMKQDWDKAQSLFEKAKELDADTRTIDEYLQQIKQRRS